MCVLCITHFDRRLLGELVCEASNSAGSVSSITQLRLDSSASLFPNPLAASTVNAAVTFAFQGLEPQTDVETTLPGSNEDEGDYEYVSSDVISSARIGRRASSLSDVSLASTSSTSSALGQPPRFVAALPESLFSKVVARKREEERSRWGKDCSCAASSLVSHCPPSRGLETGHSLISPSEFHPHSNRSQHPHDHQRGRDLHSTNCQRGTHGQRSLRVHGSQRLRSGQHAVLSQRRRLPLRIPRRTNRRRAADLECECVRRL